MKMTAVFPEGRDLLLDLLRGVANWAVFLNHMPNNVVNWITTCNYGFRTFPLTHRDPAR
jgi:hypothetical protein